MLALLDIEPQISTEGISFPSNSLISSSYTYSSSITDPLKIVSITPPLESQFIGVASKASIIGFPFQKVSSKT